MSSSALVEDYNAFIERQDGADRVEAAVPSGRTLLPGPIASLISTLTAISSLSVQVGTKIGGFWLAGARETTLTSLELSRAAIEAILIKAGSDVSDRRHGPLGKAEAETILERSVSALHSTISTASFFASSGFYLSAITLNSASALSIQGLSTLNAILGSTESSRAVAAIITLAKDELNRPEIGENGEVVGYLDLFTGTVGFALLQRWGRRKTQIDFQESGGEVSIWDTVIDDKGFRADVVGTRKMDYYGRDRDSVITAKRGRPVSYLSAGGDEAIEAIEKSTIYDQSAFALSAQEQTRLSDEEIREHIIGQLPNGAHAIITSETITAKTIKVDIYDGSMVDMVAPLGTTMISERVHHDANNICSDGEGFPHQTVIFRTALKRSSSSEIEPVDKLSMTPGGETVSASADPEGLVMVNSINSDQIESLHTEPAGLDANVIAKEKYQEHQHSSSPPSPKYPVANQKKSRKVVQAAMKGSDVLRSPFSRSFPNLTTKSTSFNQDDKQGKTGTLKRALKSMNPSQPSSSVKKVSAILSPSLSPAHGTERRSMDKNTAASSIPRLTMSSLGYPLSVEPLPAIASSDNSSPQTRLRSLSPALPRSTSKQGYFTVHEKRRESISSQTETYSTHSCDSRPGSPTLTRTHTATTIGMTKTKSEQELSVLDIANGRTGFSSCSNHQRSKSFVQSLYSVATKGSEESLVLAQRTHLRRESIFDEQDILMRLGQDGKIPGIFPDDHLVRNIRRFARFSSASYGSQFLRVMGLTSANGRRRTSTEIENVDIHHEHSSFSNHTGLPAETIILSSFRDSRGEDVAANQSPSAMFPLVHFISIDHASRAVVLTCRGTLGFEDVLTDMTCDYDDIYWRGTPYRVHKGIHASARRLLHSSGSRVMATLKAALEEFPDFGLILCGHSLGGAVAALFGVLVSEPSTIEASGVSFLTKPSPKLLEHTARHHAESTANPPISLPEGRPIHVYAYGTPATMSPSLHLATRGLITTIVNGADIVPSLSLGVLHDFRSVALNLKSDTTGAIAALKTRVLDRVKHAVQSAFYVDSVAPPPSNTAGDGIGEDTWAWAALKTLRVDMRSEKLVPPGEIFVVETTRVFDRQPGVAAAVVSDTATERVFRSLGRPATRVQMKLVRDVEGRFGELRFGSHMFSDHSPARYEATLAALAKGILED